MSAIVQQFEHSFSLAFFGIGINTKSTWVQLQKWKNDLDSFPRQIIQHHSNPNLCPQHLMPKKLKLTGLWRPTISSKTNIKKKVIFLIEELNAKVGSQEIARITGIWSCSTKRSRAKANRISSREHTDHNKFPVPIQEMTAHGYRQNVSGEIRLTILFATKDGETLYSQQNKTWNWLWLRSLAYCCKIQA